MANSIITGFLALTNITIETRIKFHHQMKTQTGTSNLENITSCHSFLITVWRRFQYITALLTCIILSDMIAFAIWHTNLYLLHCHDDVHMIPLGRWDCWAVSVKEWTKCPTGFDGDFHASHEAVPEISAAHGVIVHVPHHDPLLFSAIDRRRNKRYISIYSANYSSFS
jgi:hypothetical protein